LAGREEWQKVCLEVRLNGGRAASNAEAYQ